MQGLRLPRVILGESVGEIPRAPPTQIESDADIPSLDQGSMAAEARWLVTGEIHSAEDFWGSTTVNPDDFVCPECDQAAKLKSFKEYNEKLPHFAQVKPHATDCPLRVPDHLNSPTPQPLPPRPRRVIDELILRPLDKAPGTTGVPKPGGPPGPSSPGGPGGIQSGRTAGGVRAVVRLYDELPRLRSERLRVPGCKGNTYGSVFRGLTWEDRAALTDVRIYYGSLQYATPVLEKPDGFEVTFIQGESGVRGRKFRLAVRTDGWSQEQVKAVRHELKLALQDTEQKAKSQQQRRRPSKNDIKPWVFFLGQPDPEDPMRFIVAHPLAVCSFKRRFSRLGGDPEGMVSSPSTPVETSPPIQQLDHPDQSQHNPVATSQVKEMPVSSRSAGNRAPQQSQSQKTQLHDLDVVSASQAPVPEPASLWTRVKSWFKGVKH